MREVAATGDLTRKIALRHGNRWDDEDARLLATTFNTLTDSIARFQREMSQKERLSSLGRLSTVIAHEVRNPLMIIKAALHALRQPDADAGRAARGGGRHRRRSRAPQPARQRGARLRAADPVRAGAGRPQRAVPGVGRRGAGRRPGRAGAPAISMPARPTLTTDAERLRIALVNMLVNARHAVERRQRRRRAVVDAAARRRRAADRVRDHRRRLAAPGIDAAPTSRAIFDPYFTTKRGGTGLGLPIAKNIVEGLGGTIGVTSAPGAGTEIRIDLPLDSVATRDTLMPDAPRLDSARRRRREDSQGARPRAARRRPRGRGNRQPARRRSGCSPSAPSTCCIVDNMMPELSGLDLIREYVGVDARGRAAADPDDDGARHRRERDRGDEARRARLPAEAVRDRRTAGRGPARARAPAAAHRVPLSASASATSSSITTASSAAAARWRRSSSAPSWSPRPRARC